MNLLTVKDAVKAGLTISRGNAHTMRRLESASKQFFEFVDSKPELKYWQQVDTQSLRDYLAWLRGRDVGAQTQRNYLSCIRLAVNAIEEIAPDQYKKIFFKRITPEIPLRPARYLTPERLVACINSARMKGDHAACVALIMGGGCGLRFEEIVKLRHKDFEFDQQGSATLTVLDSKNKWSTRVIALPDFASTYMGVFLQFYQRWPHRNDESYCKAIRRTMNRMYKETKDETYRLLKPRDCARKTFCNLAHDANVPAEQIRSYIGHAPETTLEAHYLSRCLPDDLPDIKARQLRKQKENIVKPIEKALQSVSLNR